MRAEMKKLEAAARTVDPDPYARRPKTFKAVNESLAKFLEQLEERFPNFGTNDYEACVAHLLDPTTHGILLKKVNGETGANCLQETIERLVAEHPSTAYWQALHGPPLDDAVVVDVTFGSTSGSSGAIAKPKGKKKLNFVEAALEDEGSDETNPGVPPLQAELDFYLSQKRQNFGQNILTWWSRNANQYKLLAEVARYLIKCFQ